MKVFELLADEKCWTKRTLASTEDGYMVAPQHPLATRFCLKGAIDCCYRHNKTHRAIELKVYHKLEAVGHSSAVSFNDAPQTTHADVLALCRKLDI